MEEHVTHFSIFNIPMEAYDRVSSFISDQKKYHRGSFQRVSLLCDVIGMEYKSEFLEQIKKVLLRTAITPFYDMTYASDSVGVKSNALLCRFEVFFDVGSNFNNVDPHFQGCTISVDYEAILNGRRAKQDKEDNMGEHHHMHMPWEIRSNICYSVIPKITDVEVFDDGLITVKITFADGTHTTATCSENDDFDFEVGIGICIGKRALGSKFNSMVDKAVKLYTKTQEEKLKKSVEEIEELKRAIHKEQKRVERIKRREERERQETIDILAEAIKKAHETGGETEEAAVIQRFADKVSRDKAILKLREEGHSFADISRKVGCSAKTVTRVVRDKNKG